ncbi:hypothetical protein [uncultured Roseobacter sp.]|uniref:cupredoxin domain-containing protein n=1 Tax=uncultured Roseobacter sp. TaxID=114847 RepID=UPI00260955B5|nr:hypothetical protein [uncultured Roseobacter sp.]
MRVKSVFVVTLFFLGLAPFSAAAQEVREHVIFILAGTYFPVVTEVTAGDHVRFVNVSGAAHSVRHLEGLWETPQMPEGQELVIAVTDEMTGIFKDDAGHFAQGELKPLSAPQQD